MNNIKKNILTIILIGLVIGGIVSYVFRVEILNYLTKTERDNENIEFSYKIDGIYGTNYSFVNGTWTFTPISYASDIYNLSFEDIAQGFKAILDLNKDYCVITTHYLFQVNVSIEKMCIEIFDNANLVYAKNSTYNLTFFDFGLFSIDLRIIVTIYLPNPSQELAFIGVKT